MMRFFKIFCFLVLFSIQPPMTMKASDELIGKWVSLERSKGGLGAALIFGEEGKMHKLFGAFLDFKYEIQDSSLKTTFHRQEGEDPHSVVYSFECDDKNLSLVLLGNPDRKQSMERLTKLKDGVPPIVGRWFYQHETGKMATMEFLSNGEGQITVPFEIIRGQFEVERNLLKVDFENEEPHVWEMKLMRDNLHFRTDHDNKGYSYGKFEGEIVSADVEIDQSGTMTYAPHRPS